jgi:PLP dependent protein
VSDQTNAEVISDNVSRVRDEIADATQRSGRSVEDVSLMAVTKTRNAEQIDAVIGAGVGLVGENRIQEAEAKKPHVTQPAEWHMIGHLQSNKVASALQMFDAIQSVDTLKLAQRISRLTQEDYDSTTEGRRRIPVLVEVNTAGEESKFGFDPSESLDSFGKIRELPGLDVRGFMTIGRFVSDEVVVRSCFSTLRDIHDAALAAHDDDLPILSMGMTSDYVWAVEEGSTLIRVGTGIFGPR